MPNMTDRARRAASGRSAPAAAGHIDKTAQDYIDAIASEHRPLFDRLHRLILEVHPEATVVLSYQIPTYKVGGHRFYVGVWKHGVSIYGLKEGRDAGFIARHQELKTSKGTFQLRQEDAAGISDDEIRDLVRAALAARPGRSPEAQPTVSGTERAAAPAARSQERA
jgi:uncharacterized protein YdhG (YjbR/CyaY superfamily)